eukprot:1810621-Heterocapsa_arctica.AAC.1
MGSRIKRPVYLQGITRKEANNEMPTDGSFIMKVTNIKPEVETLERSLRGISCSKRMQNWGRILRQG